MQFKENARTDRRTEGQTKDGQTLFYRTLPATAGGPINPTGVCITCKNMKNIKYDWSIGSK